MPHPGDGQGGGQELRPPAHLFLTPSVLGEALFEGVLLLIERPDRPDHGHLAHILVEGETCRQLAASGQHPWRRWSGSRIRRNAEGGFDTVAVPTDSTAPGTGDGDLDAPPTYGMDPGSSTPPGET